MNPQLGRLIRDMNLFFLISFAGLAASLAAVLLAVLIWKDLAVYFKSLQSRIVRGFEPLADAARLDRAARRLNHLTLEFESAKFPELRRI